MDGDVAMRKNKISVFWRKKQYVIAGAIVAVAVVGMTTVYSMRQAEERAEKEQELAEEWNAQNTEELAALEEESEAAEASSVVKPRPNPEEIIEEAEIAEAGDIPDETDTEEKEPAEPAAVQSEALHFVETELLWPMEGNVILNYSMDATVYFATLDQYKYNPAVIIAGDVNSKVYSVAKGQITAIENNEVTGTTVTVDLGDGYEAIYGQLKELNFAVGDYVEAGHVLGYISEPTKYFSVEGSNLYFELQKDGTPIDPIEFFE